MSITRADYIEGRKARAAEAERYAERFPGWKRSEARRCPRVVAGKRCLAFSGWGRWPRRCICERHHRVLDHRKLWHTPDGTVLTSEPYGLDGEEFAVFVAECAELGLRVRVYAYSPYNPGETVLMEVCRDNREKAS